MTKEFNPTKKDLLMLEEALLSLKTKKNGLVTRKVTIQNSLSNLKESYSHIEYNSIEFKKIKKDRQKLKEVANEIEIEIKKINDEVNFKTKLKLEVEYHLNNNKSLEGKEDLDKLISNLKKLQTKYQQFAKDRTRIASLRIMASEIVDEIGLVINK